MAGNLTEEPTGLAVLGGIGMLLARDGSLFGDYRPPAPRSAADWAAMGEGVATAVLSGLWSSLMDVPPGPTDDEATEVSGLVTALCFCDGELRLSLARRLAALALSGADAEEAGTVTALMFASPALGCFAVACLPYGGVPPEGAYDAYADALFAGLGLPAGPAGGLKEAARQSTAGAAARGFAENGPRIRAGYPGWATDPVGTTVWELRQADKASTAGM